MRNLYATVPYLRTIIYFCFCAYVYIFVLVLSFCVRVSQVDISTMAVIYGRYNRGVQFVFRWCCKLVCNGFSSLTMRKTDKLEESQQGQDREKYIDEAMRQLSDRDVYILLQNDPTAISIIMQLLRRLTLELIRSMMMDISVIRLFSIC